MTTLYLDLESIPAQRPDILQEIRDAKQEQLDAAIASVAPPGNYKKQETIDEWMLNEAPKQRQKLQDAYEADVEAEYRKTGLDGAFGQVCVIGMAKDDEQPLMLIGGMKLAQEKDLLERFSAALREMVRPVDLHTTQVVGHHVLGFDLRFLLHRHIVHGIKPHSLVVRAANAKPWESEKVYDTMLQWAGAGGKVSLDKLCKALSIPSPKQKMTGADVWPTVRDGGIEDVAEYCRADVEAVRAVYRRMNFLQ